MVLDVLESGPESLALLSGCEGGVGYVTLGLMDGCGRGGLGVMGATLYTLLASGPPQSSKALWSSGQAVEHAEADALPYLLLQRGEGKGVEVSKIKGLDRASRQKREHTTGGRCALTSCLRMCR